MKLPSDIASYDLSRLIFLCGAGILYESPINLQTVNRFIIEILESCRAESSIVQDVERELYSNKISSRFEVLIDEIRKLRDPLLKVGEVFDSKGFNENHCFLARMLEKGASVLARVHPVQRPGLHL